MNKTVCKYNMCTGCKACLDICPKKAVTFEDVISSMNVFINTNKCIECGACHEICQVNNPVELSRPFFWKQGWAESSVRSMSSSGGVGTQLIKSFVNEESYVCSCVFEKGEFKYYCSNRLDEVSLFRGSKYVKSDPEGIYKEILKLLIDGKRVLFVGLPCHVAAVKKYLRGRYLDRLFTVDLICHGSPSPKLLAKFLDEHRQDIGLINNIQFRQNTKFGVTIDNKSIAPMGSFDKYTYGFLRGLFYTDNCYLCKYASFNRISDITIGDSWGTEMIDEEGKGVSLVLCQTQKGKELLLNSNLFLFDVDIEKAIANNHQLQRPSIKISERSIFFEKFKKSGNVEKAVFSCFPKECIKQDIKGLLIKMHMKKV